VTRASAPGLPASVARLEPAALWVRFEGGETTGSTNDDCRALAAAGAPEGTVVLASEQTAGRGRLGRVWASPRGGVYMSVLLRPRIPAAEAGPLPLVIGLGVALGLESLGVRVAMKWPNDILDGDGRGKLAGVLLESGVVGDTLGWVVAGCGIDVAPPRTGGPEPGAVYVDELRDQPTRPDRVAAAVLDGIADAYGRFTRGGFAPMLSAYEGRSALAGREVSVRDASGTLMARGVVGGVDTSGRLLVDGDDGRIAVASGDVTLRSL
jgi:BirA family biotin operon repressor/biotin-[acetyl-CoA-carboxylase] ligase